MSNRLSGRSSGLFLLAIAFTLFTGLVTSCAPRQESEEQYVPSRSARALEVASDYLDVTPEYSKLASGDNHLNVVYNGWVVVVRARSEPATAGTSVVEMVVDPEKGVISAHWLNPSK